jgi:hypothetical protein
MWPFKQKIKKMKIWRVQNDMGECPYNLIDEILCDGFLYKHNIDKEFHPNPMNDKGIQRNIEPNEICGFINRKQMCKWFTLEELQKLRKAGYYPKRVEVKKITAIGEYQVLAEV